MNNKIKLSHHVHTPMITLHNMLIIWKIQHSSIQYTPMKWMHHYLQQTPPHQMIMISMLICQVYIVLMKINPIPHHQEESIPKVSIHTEMFLLMLTSNIMILIMVMHSLSQTNIQCFYNKNYKIHIGVYMIPQQLKVIIYPLKWT